GFASVDRSDRNHALWRLGYCRNDCTARGNGNVFRADDRCRGIPDARKPRRGLDRALAIDCWRRLHDLCAVLPGRNLGHPDFAGQTWTATQSEPKQPILRTKSVVKTFG